MREYMVYKHTFPNGKVYIGMTCQTNPNRRWDQGRGYKTQELMGRAIEKYGWENVTHEIIATGLTKADAERLEINLITEFKSNDPRHGYNIDNGGNCTGTHSEETKRRIGDAQKGDKNHNYGKPSPLKGRKMTEEQIETNRRVHLGQPSHLKGKHLSPETVAKMRKPKTEEHKRKLSEAKAVPVVCVETGRCFKSGKTASVELGINRGSISRAIHSGQMAGGYHWQRENQG